MILGKIKTWLIFFRNRVEEVERRNKELEKAIDDCRRRISELELRNRQLGFDQLGGRIDYRLTRLEILSYYSKDERYEKLDFEQKSILKYIDEEFLKELPTKFFKPNLPPPTTTEEPAETVCIKENDGMFYWEVSGKKIYMSDNSDEARRTAKDLSKEFFTKNPHLYMDSDDYIPEGAVVADIGAAEGLFGILHINRIKKLYVFENDENWIKRLEKTFAPYKEKVCIVRGTVGDKNDNIKLDEFFSDKEKPTFVKLDIEGHERYALNGMKSIINSDNPLTMLICTYHRQSDWNYFYNLLHEKYTITSSPGYFSFMPDPIPPFFRHGVMRAIKKINLNMENKIL